ncbi:Succinate dehydrogenase cytochrome b560 subunit [Taphrina deformans PYCC 5710]|uniref:Succinate dehydrogenase cytochrome b560 subunit n=1 Tax=Taphrina deformans (strain PYCC 5710 / ATCC 11124 / CBS 356.35 / IMI 108563 / JCM 9778 / NBRC 8474) TaxID=1097556 RepID=R4X6L7_TAPDE|nr:Succinate dehydrogenase cytochrome b560 subunit [Taphrina deformans PYCC 5710]|eukprot:CCG80807.1 Succinate dehydrogenase cytochrome b560 subunit [Taphrina deformans PYCC 5710]
MLARQMLARSLISTGRTGSLLQRPLVRSAATTSLTQDESVALLEQQRRRRPNSPHLTVYKAQLTSTLSILNRLTGLALSGGLYVFAGAYLAAPLTGWHLDSATIAEAFGSLNEYTKFVLKTGAALPFTYHSWNGIRHLIWDTASELSLKGGMKHHDNCVLAD